ncbi:hypothetical protein [Paracoccus sp. MC1854]|uniref:hypothetical protein n=1 Tax=Paracoccus sp. MC1854 TaxID=2760306 RepID=UPI0016000AB5|nr:hypothetical protein [Paracoccus sp. MC1854]
MSGKIDFGKLSQEFQPGRRVEPTPPVQTERWPSREVRRESQLSIKGAAEVLERFKTMCEDERYPYYIQLHRLMNAWEGKPADEGIKNVKG